MSKRSELKFLGDVLDHRREARDLVAGTTVDDFVANRQLQLAVTHLLQIIGEAAYHLSAETRGQCPEVPWTDIIGMRHRLVHDYAQVSYRFVWETATRDLDPMIAAIEKILPPEPPDSAR